MAATISLQSNLEFTAFDKSLSRSLQACCSCVFGCVQLTFNFLPALAGQLGSFPYTGVGCFRDAIAKPRPFPEMLGNFRNQIDLTNPNSTVAKCAAKAYIGGFQYFGIEYLAECWSGPGGNLTYNKFGPSSQCTNGLGGDESLFVYKFNNPRKLYLRNIKHFPCRYTVISNSALRASCFHTELRPTGVI